MRACLALGVAGCLVAGCGRLGFDPTAARDGGLPTTDGGLPVDPLVHARSTLFDAQCATLVFTADALAVDPQGNVYIAGCVSGTGSFGALPYSTAAPETGYIAALDRDLAVTSTRVIAATTGTNGFFELGVGGGYVHATGLFDTAVDAGGGALATLGADDLLHARYEPVTLAYHSADGFGSVADDDNGFGLAVAEDGTAIVGGGCNGTIFDFGGVSVPGGDRDPCVGVIDDGVGLAAYRWPTAGIGGTSSLSLPAGDLAIAGYYEMTPPFPGLGVGAMPDGFVARIGLDGTLRWAADLVGPGDDAAIEVADHAGEVFAMGFINGPATLDGQALPFEGVYDGWIARFDADGELVWVTMAATPGDDDIRNAVADDETVLIAGNFEGTLVLGTDLLVSAGGSDFFVAALARSDGAVRWARRFGGPGVDRVRAMDVYGTRVYLTGLATPPLDLGGGTLTGTRTGAFVLALEPP